MNFFAPQHPSARAFTLIELMVSVALALLLILGINQIFRITSETAGAGQALSSAVHNDRAVQEVLYQDGRNAVTNGAPCFIINARQIYAFRSAADAATDADGNVQTDSTGTIRATSLSARSHRIDTLGFFARDLFQRQTSATGFSSNTTSSEAWIVYGHCSLPNNAAIKGTANGAFFNPAAVDSGGAVNDNNRYASDWILGRIAMLLVPSPTDTGYMQSSTGVPVSPLGSSSTSSDGFNIAQSRYDEAQTSISQFQQTLNIAAGGPAGNPAPTVANWYSQLCDFRYQCNPFPVKPLTSQNMAQVAPCFVRGCTQFVVEYAGDFCTQDGYGRALVNASGQSPPDGQIDYTVDNGVRKIRWYGFPRDVNGDGVVSYLTDVAPLRDLLANAVNAAGGAQALPPASFERNVNTWLPIQNDYAANPYTLVANKQYLCAWGPDSTEPLPKMIRITIAVDDPNGRLADAQQYEYVIDLQQ